MEELVIIVKENEKGKILVMIVSTLVQQHLQGMLKTLFQIMIIYSMPVIMLNNGKQEIY